MDGKYLREQFKKESGLSEISPGIDIFRVHYIAWLENQLINLSKTEATQEPSTYPLLSDVADLKKCSCGNNAKVVEHCFNGESMEYSVRCKNHGYCDNSRCSNGVGWHSTINDAVQVWNEKI